MSDRPVFVYAATYGSYDDCLDDYDVLLEVGRGSWHPESDTLPWIRFNLKAHFQQAELLRVRAERTSMIWGELEEIVRSAGMPERAIYALFDATVGFRLCASVLTPLSTGNRPLGHQP